MVPAGAELWSNWAEDNLIKVWKEVGISLMERIGSSVPGRGNGRSKGRETRKHLSL